ncbi:MAG: sugar phosphate isomerase/epimerase [Planctomycetaceae bacterium]|nr:sugar phosphate isomerase/epimerase [Planctomycetaceae bacterium]
MHLSCLTNSYGRFGPEAALELVPRTGVTFLELPVRNEGMVSFFKETPLLTDASDPDTVQRVLERIHDAGLRLSSCNLTSGNPLQAEALERTLRKIRIAGQLGVSLVVAGGGEIESDEDWPTLVNHMRQIGDAAEEQGIIYCCETHPGTCQNADRMLEFLDRVNHPQIRINFDTGNIFYYNEGLDVYHELQRVLPSVRHVHLKDTNGGFKDWHFPEFGAGGAVDFVRVREILEGAGYEGPASLEIEGIQGEPELTLDQYQQRFVDSVVHLQKCGWTV